MLIFRVVLLFTIHCLTSADLLDLFVEHMDEEMKTPEYKRQHSKISRNRNKRSVIEGPFFHIGNYRKQRLDVDESWQKSLKNKTKSFKEDGLDYPNRHETNTEPNQYELFNSIESQGQKSLEKIDDERLIINSQESSKGGVLKKHVPKKYFSGVKKRYRRYCGKRSIFEESEMRSEEEDEVEEINFSRSEIMDENGDVVLEWDPSDEKIVTFKVTARTLGYIGIGFNEKSHMKGADLILAWVNDHTQQVSLLDSHGLEEANTAPVTDVSQDVEIVDGYQNETHTTIIFSRKWETCDPEDKPLNGDTIRVLWAMHPSDPELNSAAFHGEKRGGRALRLRAPAPHPPPPPRSPDVQFWDIKLNQFAVSDTTDTEYWCKIFKAPMVEKHHMIGYTPLVEKANEALVHHVILYECVSTSPTLGKHTKLAGAHCYSPTMPKEWESCLQPVLAWARGSKGEWFPEHIGIPVAEHTEGSYYMLEVHYNNPGHKKIIDSSGVRIHYTSNLRKNEAGILVAGVAVTPLHVVPPRQKKYATAGYCTQDCTNMMLPNKGVNVVSVVLHSHLAGRQLSLKHIREGNELPPIVEDNHFDFDYQQSHTLEKEVKILPGDEIVAECVYGTLDRKRPTLGGYAASQEMCLAFVVHYPRTELAACYSMTPVKDLFETLGINTFKGISMDHLEKIFLSTGFDALALPNLTKQQHSVYPAVQPNDKFDKQLVKEAESALRALRDYKEADNNDELFSTLIIEEPSEFRGRTFAEHMLSLPWTEELLSRSIEKSLYHGKHMTFCRMRNDNLAMPVTIQNFPNFTALPEPNNTYCAEMRRLSSSVDSSSSNSFHLILTITVSLWWSFR
ncbi:MOXD1 homolog 1 [Leptopilina heterotoma]|uniref:MOXD1 homolog 1 n=1 Tax=Leptopilina heterotoma TaxID=63436 RepID=UPI001CA7E8A6|nr:MOXD1 homolog 1 [Leptopilina heterotoma]